MYPMGSNGAGQAILDANSLATHLAHCDDVVEALSAYERDRLPVTADIVLRNRAGGPEQVIDEVERRAPNGFARLDDVIDPATLHDIVNHYAQASQSSAQRRR
jgi:2-polyprenyl-6-methoxyphenol hydroxylase-like FAD-dependent oxidoreductase